MEVEVEEAVMILSWLMDGKAAAAAAAAEKQGQPVEDPGVVAEA